MKQTIEILTDERRCGVCLYFDLLRFLASVDPGWCKERGIFTGKDWRICDLFRERKVSDGVINNVME